MAYEEYGFPEKGDWEKLGNGTLIHRTALIAPWVRFENDCIVYPFSIIGRLPDKNSKALARDSMQIKCLKIGKNSIIGCNTIIYGDVILGDDCYVGDYASIREGSRIGDMCVIGRQVTINYNVKIGNRSRFQDGTHITGNCIIGDDCFFGVDVVTSNDRNVDLEDYHFPEPQPPIFGNKILIGSGANILAGVKVGSGSIIGAGALVVKDVGENEKVLGPVAKSVVINKFGEDVSGGYLSDGERIWNMATVDIP